MLSVGVSLVLTTIKFYAFYLTGSAAVFSDALESIVNVVASMFALYAIALAHEPADDSHPYGHGKVEFLSAAFEGGMIFFAGAVVVWRAVTDIFVGAHVAAPEKGAALLAVTAVVNGIVGTILVRIGRQRSSLTLVADGRHLISDVVTTAAVLVSLVLVYFTRQTWIDPVCALLAAAYLIFTASRLLRVSTAGLMDEQDTEDDRLLRSILDAHVAGTSEPKICSYHKLRHRHAGRMHWIDFHACVPMAMNVHDAHKVASAVEHEIEKALGEADATAHMEPCAGCPACAEVEAQVLRSRSAE